MFNAEHVVEEPSGRAARTSALRSRQQPHSPTPARTRCDRIRIAGELLAILGPDIGGSALKRLEPRGLSPGRLAWVLSIATSA